MPASWRTCKRYAVSHRRCAYTTLGAYVVIGDAERKQLDELQRHSFEMFRRSFKDVVVITYGELFGGIQHLAVWTEPPPDT